MKNPSITLVYRTFVLLIFCTNCFLTQAQAQEKQKKKGKIRKKK